MELNNKTDPTLPGENWFYYWKTSPSLWPQKIKLLSEHRQVFIPLNPVVHFLTADEIDVGEKRAEANLPHLIKLCAEHNLEAVLLFPVSPAPFLTNGGLPSFLAKSLAISNKQLAYAILDHDHRLNKVYSFYNPKVYPYFKKLYTELSKALSQLTDQFQVIGINSSFFSEGQKHSFWEDNSDCAERAFFRFLKNNPPTDNDELKSKKEFQKLMQELFEQVGQDSFEKQWRGTLEIIFLGSAPENLFFRHREEHESQKKYFDLIQTITDSGEKPTCILIPPHLKEGNLSKFSKLLSSFTLSNQLLNHSGYEDHNTQFKNERFFQLILQDSHLHNPFIAETGLLQNLEKNYRASFVLENDINVKEDNEFKNIIIFDGEAINDISFKKILRAFLAGYKIIINRSNLEKIFEKKILQFVLENDLSSEKVRHHTVVESFSLGMGRIVLFDADQLKENKLENKEEFWQAIWNYLNVKHISVLAPKDIFFLWRSRYPQAGELQFARVLELNLFNPTSYKKTIQLKVPRNFSMSKQKNQHHAQVKNLPSGPEIEILPGGSLALEFGQHEDGESDE